MAQFDVYRNPRGTAHPLLLDVQSEVLSRLATRAVVPMIAIKRYGAKPISRLNPTAKIAGVEYVLLVQELAAIPASMLSAKLTSLAARRAEIVAALDLLLTGL
jgi:toxin CcdB